MLQQEMWAIALKLGRLSISSPCYITSSTSGGLSPESLIKKDRSFVLAIAFFQAFRYKYLLALQKNKIILQT